MNLRHETAEWRATSERSGTRVLCETDDCSRSEVRGFRNVEPRTSNFVSRLSRVSRPSRLSQVSVRSRSVMNNGEKRHRSEYATEYRPHDLGCVSCRYSLLKRDGRDDRGFEVRSSRSSNFEPRTSNLGSRLTCPAQPVCDALRE